MLITPGVYPKEVVVTKPYLTFEGFNRNRVILTPANGIKVPEGRRHRNLQMTAGKF